MNSASDYSRCDSYQNIDKYAVIRRPQSSLANNPVSLEKDENPPLFEKGFNFLLSISDRVEELKVCRYLYIFD